VRRYRLREGQDGEKKQPLRAERLPGRREEPEGVLIRKPGKREEAECEPLQAETEGEERRQGRERDALRAERWQGRREEAAVTG
jgi:hypothetical protein